MTLRNSNDRVAYPRRAVSDALSRRERTGRRRAARFDQRDLPAGGVVRLEMNDGFVTTPFASATIEVLGAEALLPLP